MSTSYVSISKDRSTMTVSQEDYDLVYKNQGWQSNGVADVRDEESRGKYITIDPLREFVAGPKEMPGPQTNEGQTILEDEHGDLTPKGKEEAEKRSKIGTK